MSVYARVFREAAAILDAHKLAQGCAARDVHGLVIDSPGFPRAVELSLPAAVEIAIDRAMPPRYRFDAYQAALEELFGGDLEAIVWNDAEGRTKAEAVARLRAAAGEAQS